MRVRYYTVLGRIRRYAVVGCNANGPYLAGHVNLTVKRRWVAQRLIPSFADDVFTPTWSSRREAATWLMLISSFGVQRPGLVLERVVA